MLVLLTTTIYLQLLARAEQLTTRTLKWIALVSKLNQTHLASLDEGSTHHARVIVTAKVRGRGRVWVPLTIVA